MEKLGFYYRILGFYMWQYLSLTVRGSVSCVCYEESFKMSKFQMCQCQYPSHSNQLYQWHVWIWAAASCILSPLDGSGCSGVKNLIRKFYNKYWDLHTPGMSGKVRLVEPEDWGRSECPENIDLGINPALCSDLISKNCKITFHSSWCTFSRKGWGLRK